MKKSRGGKTRSMIMRKGLKFQRGWLHGKDNLSKRGDGIRHADSQAEGAVNSSALC